MIEEPITAIVTEVTIGGYHQKRIWNVLDVMVLILRYLEAQWLREIDIPQKWQDQK